MKSAKSMFCNDSGFRAVVFVTFLDNKFQREVGMKIVNIGGACLTQQHRDELGTIAEFVDCGDVPKEDQKLIECIGDADIIITFLNRISAQVINAAPNLKMICVAATGFDSVDVKAATQKNITVCYVPGYATEAVAEHTIGLIIAAARLTFPSFHAVKTGVKDVCEFAGKELMEKTLGVIGYGRIGKRVAEIAKNGLGMNVIYTDADSTREDLEDVLKQSDVISIHVPLTSQTQNMIGTKEFELMKDSVIFINTARGDVIDEKALIESLKSGKVFAAGLDVVKDEPLKKDNPLLAFQNVFITPHIGYYTDVADAERSKLVVENIKNFIDGNHDKLLCVTR
jgi:phosphoglycerate dehydrogenase-like enzyme